MKKIFLICMCILLCGCSPKITEGEVYNKKYLPEKTWIQLMPVVVSNGKTCTTRLIPYTFHRSEEYIIYIKDKDITESFYTNEDTYNKTHIGDIFIYDENRDLTYEPIEKKRKE